MSEGGGESQEENGEADRRQPRPYNRTRKFFRRRRTPQSETRAKESGDTVSVNCSKILDYKASTILRRTF